MLRGKCVVLGVTGSIAAYKIANLASALVKRHADVNVIMTKNATNFINPITFETLTGNKCLVDTFDRNFQFNVEHVALAKRADQQDIIIKTAAVADYRPSDPADEKVKKKDADTMLQLERTEDILAFLGAHRREGQFICGFSMETENMLENSRAKLAKKNVDMIVANNLKVAGAGFGTDTNVVTLITKDDCRQLEIMSKADVAAAIVSEILQKMQ